MTSLERSHDTSRCWHVTMQCCDEASHSKLQVINDILILPSLTWLWSDASLPLSTGPNWTPLEVLAHLQGISMLHVVLLVPSLGRNTHCCWWGVVLVKLWVYSKTCGCWMLTERCGVRLVPFSWYMMSYVKSVCCTYTLPVAHIHVAVCLESIV